MVAIDKRYRQQGVVVLGLSDEEAATQRQFAQEKGVTYPLLVDNGKLPEPYAKVSALPTTFVIDRKGVLREVLVGYQEGALELIVTELLQER